MEIIILIAVGAVVGWLIWRSRSGSEVVRAPASNVDSRLTPFDAEGPGSAWRKMTASHQEVVGEQHYAAAIEAFAEGRDHAVEVERQPANPHDRNALAVIGIWRDDDGERRGHLGFLPRQFAADVAKARPADMPIRARPARLFRDGDYCDLKVDVYEPSVRSGYWAERNLAPPGQIANS